MTRIQLTKPVITQDMVEAAIYALQNERLVLGESVSKLEEEFAQYIGVKYAVAVNSGTSALILAYHAIGLNNATSFIVPTTTFISTASAGALLGAKPIFVDIKLSDYTIDENKVLKLMEKDGVKAKAIIPVHLYGFPAEIRPLIEAADENSIYVIEDAAQAHGAIYNGRRVGSLGHVAVFSFYPTKNMTVGGDGGMLVTNDEKVAEIAKKLRDCGRASKYLHDTLGYVFRMNTVNAAIGRVQLRYLDYWNEKRREKASLYDKLLAHIDEVVTPPKPTPNKIPVYHLYVIRLANEEHRNALGAWLLEHGIETLIHYPIPLHKQPVFRNTVVGTDLSNAELHAKTALSLPLFVELKDDEVKFICEKVYEFFDKALYKDREWIKKGRQWLEKFI